MKKGKVLIFLFLSSALFCFGLLALQEDTGRIPKPGDMNGGENCREAGGGCQTQ